MGLSYDTIKHVETYTYSSIVVYMQKGRVTKHVLCMEEEEEKEEKGL